MRRWQRAGLKRAWALGAAVAFFPCVFMPLPKASAQEGSSSEAPRRYVPYVPTPMTVVRRMLQLAKVTRHDVVYDLGSGDGRIVIMAAQKFGARAVGVELDPELVHESSARILKLGLGGKAQIIYGNLFQSDVRPATVVTLYLTPSANDLLAPILDKELRSGTRVVANDFPVNPWNAVKTVQVTDEYGDHHTLYLYVRP